MTNPHRRARPGAPPLTARLFGDPGAMAPDVDKAWRDDFMLELRLLDVPGDRIGDALMTVQTHVAESGESAEQAFGDPRAYAHELAGRSRVPRWAVGPGAMAGAVLGVLGMVTVAKAFGSWLEGTAVTYVVGDLVALGALLALMAVVLLRLGSVLRSLVDHPWASFAVLFLGVGALLALPALLLRAPLPTLPVPVMAAAGAGLLMAGSAVTLLLRTGPQDLVTAPGEEPGGADGRVLAALVPWGMTLLVLLVTWVPSLVG